MYYNSTYVNDTECWFSRYTHTFAILPFKEWGVIPLSQSVSGAQWLASHEQNMVQVVEGTLRLTAVSVWGFSLSPHFLPLITHSGGSHAKRLPCRNGRHLPCGDTEAASCHVGTHGERQRPADNHTHELRSRSFPSWALKWLQSWPTAWRWHQERGCPSPILSCH